MANKETGEDILRAIQEKGNKRVQEQISKVLAEQDAIVAEVKEQQKGKLSKKDVKEVFDELYDKKTPSRRREFIDSYNGKENAREVEFDELYKAKESERQAQLKMELARAFNEMYDAKHKQREIARGESDQRTDENAEYKRDIAELKYRVGNMSSLQRENNYMLRESLTLQTKSVTALNLIASKISGTGGGALGAISTAAITAIATGVFTTMMMGRAFARGTDNAPGGPALVGEEGPELIQGRSGGARLSGHGVENLDAGDKVASASKTRQIMSQGSAQQAPPSAERKPITPQNLAGAIGGGPVIAPKKVESTNDKILTIAAREIKFVSDKIMFEVDTFKIDSAQTSSSASSGQSQGESPESGASASKPPLQGGAGASAIKAESGSERAETSAAPVAASLGTPLLAARTSNTNNPQSRPSQGQSTQDVIPSSELPQSASQGELTRAPVTNQTSPNPSSAPRSNGSSALRDRSGRVISTASTNLTPQQRALLDTIAKEEARDYNTIVGSGKFGAPPTFSDFSKHPNVIGMRSGPNKSPSTAAGRYQFTGTTWRAIVPLYNAAHKDNPIRDFSPASQDRAALFLAQRDYKRRTGRNLDADIHSTNPEIQKSLGGLIQQGLGGVGMNTTWQGLQNRKTNWQKVYEDNLKTNKGYSDEGGQEPTREVSPPQSVGQTEVQPTKPKQVVPPANKVKPTSAPTAPNVERIDNDSSALWQKYNEAGSAADFINASNASKNMVPNVPATPGKITPLPKRNAEPNIVVASDTQQRSAPPVPAKRVESKTTHEAGSPSNGRTPSAGDSDTNKRLMAYYPYLFKGKGKGVQMDVA